MISNNIIIWGIVILMVILILVVVVLSCKKKKNKEEVDHEAIAKRVEEEAFPSKVIEVTTSPAQVVQA
jgi:uncharacterized protein YpmB